MKKIRLYILSLLFLELVQILLYLIPSPNNSENYLIWSFNFLFILSLYIVRKISNRRPNLLTIFLLFVFLFNGTRPFLASLGVNDINDLTFFYIGKIKVEDNCRAMLNLNSSILFITIGHLIYYIKSKNYHDKNISRPCIFNRVYKNINLMIPKRIPSFVLLLLFTLGFAIKLYVSYLSFSFLSTFSYHEMFVSGVSIPLYLRVIQLFPLFVCFYKISQGHSLWIWWVILYSTISAATGQRGPALMTLTVFFYYMLTRNIIHINIKKFVFLFLGFYLFSVFIGNIRNNKDLVTEDDTFSSFLWDQGVTYSELQIVVKDKEKLDYGFWDLFGNVYSMLRLNIRSNIYCDNEHLSTTAKKYKMWSKYISYETNPKLYFLGMGLGGNYIAQAYCVGNEFFVLLVSILLGFFINLLDDRYIKSGYIGGFLYTNLLITVMYIPRDNLFQFLTAMVEPLIASVTIISLLCVIKIINQYERYQKSMYCQ